MNIATATDLHDHTFELIREAMRNPARPIVVNKRGKPAVLVVDARFFAGVMETLDILSDPTTLAQLRKGMKDCRAERMISHDQMAKEFGLKVRKRRHRAAHGRRPRV